MINNVFAFVNDHQTLVFCLAVAILAILIVAVVVLSIVCASIVTSKKKVLKSTRSELLSYMDRVALAERKNMERSLELDNIRTENETNKINLDTLNESYEVLKSEFATAMESNTSLTTQIEDATTKNNNLTSKIEKLNEKVKELESENSELKTEVIELNRKTERMAALKYENDILLDLLVRIKKEYPSEELSNAEAIVRKSSNPKKLKLTLKKVPSEKKD